MLGYRPMGERRPGRPMARLRGFDDDGGPLPAVAGCSVARRPVDPALGLRMPSAIDLFCGLGGWTEGLLAEGYFVVGFDIERHVYGDEKYPGELVLQDVRTLHGSQFKNAALIVASPPCQAYSYRAMPWRRAKALPPPDNTLFEACFRIQREASEAAGRYIPLIVENVRGAQKWVGQAKANFGSYYLWGDVGMVGRRVVAGVPQFGVSVAPMKATKVPGFRFDGNGGSFQSASVEAQKRNPDGTDHGSGSWFKIADSKNRASRKQSMGGSWFGDYEMHKERVDEHIKQGGDWFGRNCESSMSRLYGSKSPKRRAASAMIAKIPFALAQHVAHCFVAS